MSWMFATCSRQSAAVQDWKHVWTEREGAPWEDFIGDLSNQAARCGVRIEDRQDGFGVFKEQVELSTRLQVHGAVGDIRRLAHLIARRHHQYAVRTLAEGGAQWSLTAPTLGLQEGIDKLIALEMPGSVFEESIEINAMNESDADAALLQLPASRLRAVSIERVSGNRSPWWQGSKILLRSL